MASEIFSKPIPSNELRRLVEETFGDMVKFVVDLENQIICVGGGVHADQEAILLDQGSKQDDLWGGNYYPDLVGEDRFEYKSMINIRPRQGNNQQHVVSDDVRRKIRKLAGYFFENES